MESKDKIDHECEIDVRKNLDGSVRSTSEPTKNYEEVLLRK